jgi:starvation-inducible outer membrane lipoprotein
MKKVFIALTTCCFLLTGCFNITEELFLENTGSGTYITTVKMDKLQ